MSGASIMPGPRFPRFYLPCQLNVDRRLVRLLLYVLGVAIIFVVFWPRSGHSEGNWDYIRAIQNETLGVQKVFVVNLPSRSDRRDAIVLGSSVSDFHVEWIDGITPDEINPKSYPYNWDHSRHPAEYAARRAHVNAMQRIVGERLGSAIIMEDDADWDVAIKAQLQSFALATRAMQETGESATASPYGDDWDVLWIGHCGLECRTDKPFVHIPNDPTILPSHRFLPYWRDPPPIERPEDSRLVCVANDGVCSIVYAVSYHGAQRILAALSANPSGIAEEVDISVPFDVSLGRLCGRGFLRCFAPYPSLTGGYRSGGSSSRSSDISDQGGDDKDEEMEGPSSSGVKYSTMMNINRILKGHDTVLSAWEDVADSEIKPGGIPVVGGVIHWPESEPANS